TAHAHVQARVFAPSRMVAKAELSARRNCLEVSWRAKKTRTPGHAGISAALQRIAINAGILLAGTWGHAVASCKIPVRHIANFFPLCDSLYCAKQCPWRDAGPLPPH